eukprot:5236550-Prymnesium_polylepis.3
MPSGCAAAPCSHGAPRAAPPLAACCARAGARAAAACCGGSTRGAGRARSPPRAPSHATACAPPPCWHSTPVPRRARATAG